jgi:hypothetical protein
MRHAKGDRSRPTQRFFDHCANIGKGGEVGEGRRTSEAYDFIEFGVGPDLDLGVSDDSEEPPVERSGGCLSARGTTVCEALDSRSVGDTYKGTYAMSPTSQASGGGERCQWSCQTSHRVLMCVLPFAANPPAGLVLCSKSSEEPVSMP